MRRRALLRAGAAAAAAAAWPDWLRRAFGDDACHGDPGAAGDPDEPGRDLITQVSRAWRRAHQAGKPLLVLVIPESPDRRWDRGHAFGELINNGTRAQITPLALAEVVCAGAADVRKLVPAARGEPLMFVIETDRVPAEVRRLDAELPELRSAGPGSEADDARVIETRVTILAAQVTLGLMPDRAVLTRRAEQARARLTAAERREVERGLVAPAGLGVELADRAAALILRDGSPGAVALVGDAAAARLRDNAPAGAHWASSFGCGTNVEPTAAEKREQARKAAEAARRGEDYFESGGGGVACGMGHVPAQSRRFLYFYAVDDERW